MGTGFRVMSFNIRHYWADDGENSWDRRSQALIQVLRRNQTEVICFQEVNYPIFEFLAKALPGYEVASDLKSQGPRWEYRPIYVKKPIRILEKETLSLSDTPQVPSKSWGSTFIRQVTRVLLEMDGAALAVYNTHLDFEEEVQLNQAKVIWKTVQAKDKNRPVILCGDFNSTPDKKDYGFLTGKDGLGKGTGDFKDSMAGQEANTYHGFKVGLRVGYIDWILYRGPGLDLVQPVRTLEDKPWGRFPSDHYPVVAAFGLAGKRKSA